MSWNKKYYECDKCKHRILSKKLPHGWYILSKRIKPDQQIVSIYWCDVCHEKFINNKL